MATLDDLPITSLLDLSPEQAMQLILDVRLRRALVIETSTKRTPQDKKLPSKATLDKLSEKQITDLYYALIVKQQKELL